MPSAGSRSSISASDNALDYALHGRLPGEFTDSKSGAESPVLAEGAWQKSNGKWAHNVMFPGREFDDLDAYRAAKKQRYARREEFRAQARDNAGFTRR